jgi:nitroreductase
MEFLAAARSRRMVRSFSGAPLDPAVLDSLVEVAVGAPSAGNTRGRAFVVLGGRPETALFWDATTTADWRQDSRRWAGLSLAPVIVVVLVSPRRYLDRYAEPDKASAGLGPDSGVEAWPVPYWFFDAGASVMALLLGAADAGLGACFLGNFRGEHELLIALGVDDGWRYVGAVLLGEAGGADPVSVSAARRRSPVSESVHRGGWGNH